MFEVTAGHGNGRKKGQKLPYPSLIYGVFAAQKELRFDYEFLTKKKPLVIYRLVEKSKSKQEKSISSDPDVTISALAPPADITIGPTIATLTQVKDLNAQLAKHGDKLGFVEKVSLDLSSKFKILFPATAVATPVPGNVTTSVATAQPTDSQPKEQGQNSFESPSSKHHKKSRECILWCFYFYF